MRVCVGLVGAHQFTHVRTRSRRCLRCFAEDAGIPSSQLTSSQPFRNDTLSPESRLLPLGLLTLSDCRSCGHSRIPISTLLTRSSSSGLKRLLWPRRSTRLPMNPSLMLQVRFLTCRTLSVAIRRAHSLKRQWLITAPRVRVHV